MRLKVITAASGTPIVRPIISARQNVLICVQQSPGRQYTDGLAERGGSIRFAVDVRCCSARMRWACWSEKRQTPIYGVRG
jgi:hypothetical protein